MPMHKRGLPKRQSVLICLFLALVLFFVTMFRMGLVRGASMQPTYSDGQIVLVRRLNTLGRKLRRDDVVLVENGHDVIIKRVFLLPGDQLDHSYPDVLSVSKLRDLTDYYEQKVIGAQTHYYVPDGYIVVIGDNIPVSEDSRVFGPVSVRDVLGVVVRSPPVPYASRHRVPQSEGDLSSPFGAQENGEDQPLRGVGTPR